MQTLYDWIIVAMAATVCGAFVFVVMYWTHY